MTLEDAWQSAWQGVGARASDTLLTDVLARYAEPPRAYHTRQHLTECFAALEPAAHLAERLGEVQLALWFHDAIYDPRRHDNEARSAEWAECAMRRAGADAGAVGRVHALIMSTSHLSEPDSGDARVVVDVDLAILGADEARFAEYDRQIRVEYAWLADDVYHQGRARVLRRFVERASIYHTPWFAARLEARARANLAHALANLTNLHG